jgi:hypothetical protein
MAQLEEVRLPTGARDALVNDPDFLPQIVEAALNRFLDAEITGLRAIRSSHPAGRGPESDTRRTGHDDTVVGHVRTSTTHELMASSACWHQPSPS